MRYPYLEFNPEKGDALLTAKGWTKDGNGMWAGRNGQAGRARDHQLFRLHELSARSSSSSSEQAGIDATYSEPPNIFDRFYGGDYTGALFGHGGSYSSDVYYSLRLYQTASIKIPGRPPCQLLTVAQRRVRQTGRRALWHQPDRDGKGHGDLEKGPRNLAAGTTRTSSSHKASTGLPTNTTYWTNWPDAENPYVNTAHWHLTWPLVVHMLQPAE